LELHLLLLLHSTKKGKDMRLKIRSGHILLYLHKEETYFQKVTNLLLEFSKSFQINNMLINLSTEKEIWKRKKFLLFVYKLSLNNAPPCIQELLSSYEKPIKLIIEDASSPMKISHIRLSVIHMALHVKVSKDDKLIFWYLINRFKKYNLSYDFIKREILIKDINVSLKKELSILLSKNNILSHHILYVYDKAQLTLLFRQKTSDSVNTSFQNSTLKYYYNILKVSESDSLKTIRKQYLKFAKQFHPDLQTHLCEDLAKRNTQKFYKIQEAYETIKNFKTKKLAA
jgi:molecular chaperone DnaJ